MPFIHIYAYSGRDLATKKKAAAAIVKTASELLGAPESAFTVVYQDVEREAWDKEVEEAVMDPLRDKMLIHRGKLV